MAATDQHVEQVKQGLDYALGAGAVTAPVWLQYVQTYAGFLMLVGGLVLLALRIAIAWNEWQNRKRAP